MGVDLSRDKDALYILDDDEPYTVRIFGYYTFSGVLEYNDDYYFPVTNSGTRSTRDIKEEHTDYSASFRFVQSQPDEVTVEFTIRVKNFM